MRAGEAGDGVAVVVVNYRTALLVCHCLETLEPELAALPGSEAWVVDNDSGDGSAETLAHFVEERGMGRWARVVASPRNGGFAAGNNVALRPLLAGGRHRAFLLLNPDTLVRPGAIRALLDRLDADPRTGVVGSRLEEPDGTPQGSSFRFPTPMSQLELGIDWGVTRRLLGRWATMFPPSAEAHRCDWVGGASLLLRREALAQVGLMDEGYFLYFEEVDLCLRLARAGWTCWHEPRSRVVHLEGQATGVGNGRLRRLPRYWFESRRRFFVKSYGPLVAALADAAWLLGDLLGGPLRLGRRLLGRTRPPRPERLVLDFLASSVFVRGFRLEPPLTLDGTPAPPAPPSPSSR